MRRITIVTIIAAAAGLSACGDTTGEQALIGGGVGAGTAAVLGANPLIGAAVGVGGNVLYCNRNPDNC